MTANLSTRLFAVGIAAEAMKGAEPVSALVEAAGIAIATQALLAERPHDALDQLLTDFCTRTRRLVEATATTVPKGEPA